MTTPYNTGKVKIGLRYEQAQRTYITHDEYRVQNALLGDRTADREGVFIVVGSAIAAFVVWLWLTN